MNNEQHTNAAMMDDAALEAVALCERQLNTRKNAVTDSVFSVFVDV